MEVCMDTVKATFDIEKELYDSFKVVAALEGHKLTWYVNGAIREIVEKRMGELKQLQQPKKVKRVSRASKKSGS
jgi:hypothetical protein